jgi:hypothetical protein
LERFKVFFIIFVFFASQPVSAEVRPEWTLREKISQEDSEITWFLGVYSDEDPKYAEMLSTIDSQNNIIEHVSPATQLSTRSTSVVRTNHQTTKNQMLQNHGQLPLPPRLKRVWWTREDGKVVVYTDLAVSTQDIKFVQQYKKKIPFDPYENYKNLETKKTDFVEEERRQRTFTDNNHMIFWSPIQAQNSTLASVAYEFSFWNKRIGLEVGFKEKDKGKEKGYETVEGSPVDIYSRWHFGVNFSLLRNKKELLVLSTYYINAKLEEGLRERFAGEEITVYKDKGAGVSFKYRSLFGNNSLLGHQFELGIENINRESVSRENKSFRQINGSYSWFFNF